MNQPIPAHIIEYLKQAGYDVQADQGDRVITEPGSRHMIYIKVRDGKKTYVPITMTSDAASDMPADLAEIEVSEAPEPINEIAEPATMPQTSPSIEDIVAAPVLEKMKPEEPFTPVRMPYNDPIPKHVDPIDMTPDMVPEIKLKEVTPAEPEPIPETSSIIEHVPVIEPEVSHTEEVITEKPKPFTLVDLIHQPVAEIDPTVSTEPVIEPAPILEVEQTIPTREGVAQSESMIVQPLEINAPTTESETIKVPTPQPIVDKEVSSPTKIEIPAEQMIQMSPIETPEVRPVIDIKTKVMNFITTAIAEHMVPPLQDLITAKMKPSVAAMERVPTVAKVATPELTSDTTSQPINISIPAVEAIPEPVVLTPDPVSNDIPPAAPTKDLTSFYDTMFKQSTPTSTQNKVDPANMFAA